jgi:hypothetical protein
VTIDANLARLIDLAAPYWAGEAEVVRTYWSTPTRNRDSDRRWLARQCFKEFWGSGLSKLDRGGVVLGVMKSVLAREAEIDVTIDRHDVLDWLEGIKAEFSHYCAFADLHDALRPDGTPKINPARLESWPAEDALTQLRYGHQEQHGTVGLRACKFTEGGYCALFAEGKKLAGRSGVDGQIAAACTLVYEDEIDHMLAGIAGIAQEGLTAADWQLLGELVVAQMKQRIHMRNEQFGLPLSEQRIAAIFRGEIEPARFDYDRAGLAA